MRCSKCNAEMFNAKLTGNTLYPLILTNKKKGMLEPEKRCYVLCYVCPECGYIEIYAEKPKELKIDWQIPIYKANCKFKESVQSFAVYGKDKKVNVCYNMLGGESNGFSTDRKVYSTT